MCSSDISYVLLVFTMLKGGKLSPCLCGSIFILLSHLMGNLDRSRFQLVFISVSMLLMKKLIPVWFLFLCQQPFFLFECFRMPWYMCFLHHVGYSLCPFDLEICFLQLCVILICYFFDDVLPFVFSILSF